jgi:hypothetical protein
MSEGMRASLFNGKELFDAAIARSSWTQVQLRRKANGPNFAVYCED